VSLVPQVRDRRKTHGVVYTPASIVRHIVEHTLDAQLKFSGRLSAQRVLDPACGDGAFLVEVYERLLRRYGEGPGVSPSRRADDAAIERRLAIARRHLFGIDVDAEAVAEARLRLAAIALGEDDAIRHAAESLRENLVCGDALNSSPAAPWMRPGAFSAIVSNPPYVGFRELARRRDSAPASGDGPHRDLYVQFVERIVELLAPGGRFGLIVPNKIAIADYALSCRRLLLSRTRLGRLDDVSALDAFPSVSVYPIILCGAKEAAPASHRVTISRPGSLAELGDDGEEWTIAQSEIDAAGGLPLRPPLDFESRVPTRPLGELAVPHSGATGFTARRLAEALIEREESSEPGWDFITSGNIDRFAIGRENVRFMGRTFRRPVLPAGAAILTERKRRLYREPKIVLAGMTRRLEAAWSEAGLALGVQVYAAAELRVDPHFLLAVLNSKLLSFVYRTRFQAKRLAGGFFSLNKRQLAQLPIPTVDREEPRERLHHDELSRAARRLSAPDCPAGEREALDRRIDEIVYTLFRLNREEIQTIEADVEED
jgi:SAM-dependent methyltransferase